MTENYHLEQEKRASEWHGLRPSKAKICPRVVAGKHCQIGSPRKRTGGLCVCEKHYHALDHGRVWLDRNGQHVVTGEPYNLSGARAAEFLTDMEALGLTVTFTGSSCWYPGHTLMILIRKATP